MAENKHSTWSSRRIEPVLPEPGKLKCVLKSKSFSPEEQL